jgi:hypothetical protein
MVTVCTPNHGLPSDDPIRLLDVELLLSLGREAGSLDANPMITDAEQEVRAAVRGVDNLERVSQKIGLGSLKTILTVTQTTRTAACSGTPRRSPARFRITGLTMRAQPVQPARSSAS